MPTQDPHLPGGTQSRATNAIIEEFEAATRLLAFLDISFDALYDWHLDSGYLSFNNQIDELLGHPPGTFPRSFEGWLGEIHPDDRARAVDGLDRAKSEGTAFRTEYRFRHSDGHYIMVDDHGVFLPDETGRITHMVGAMRDVTPERAAERALRESEELYQTLFRHTANPALRLDADGRCLDANEAALELLETDLGSLVGHQVSDHMPVDLGRLLGGDETAADEESGLEVDVVVKGVIKTLLLTVTACAVGGVRSFFCLGTDITARKRMQRALEQSERILREQAGALEERNTALRVLVEQRDQDRRDLEERIQANVERLIRPTLDRLGRALGARPEASLVETLALNLEEIVRPYARRLSGPETHEPLTRRELEVCNLIRIGRSTDEIARVLYISRSAVSFHRSNIRRKLGLVAGGPHLTTHLASLAADAPV